MEQDYENVVDECIQNHFHNKRTRLHGGGNRKRSHVNTYTETSSSKTDTASASIEYMINIINFIEYYIIDFKKFKTYDKG